MPQEQSQSDSNDSPCPDLETFGKFKWSSHAIRLLLKLRSEMAHLFANPPGKKILLWNEISEELKKNNYNVSGKLCFAKFRNLTASYRRRKEMGPSYCHWEFMDLMDTFFNDHPSSFVLESENTLDQTFIPSTGDQTHSVYIVQSVDEEEMEQDGEQVEEETQVMEEYEETTVEEQEEEEEEEQLQQQEQQQQEEEEEEKEFHWSPLAVNLLLNLRFQRNQAFSLPPSQIRKAELWNDISTEMKKNNFNVPGYVCDLKYRSLLRHYRVKKERTDLGAAGNSWIHFDLMDAYLGDNDSKSNRGSLHNQQDQSVEGTSSTSSALYTLIQDTVEDESQGSPGLKEGRDGFQWTPDAIKLFLKLRFDRQRQFLDPVAKKFKLWEEIGKEMKKNGYNISGFGCDNKFRNLLTTYRSVKRKIGAGDKFVRWRYFEIFDAHYKHEPFAPIKNVTVKSNSLNMSDQQDGEEDEERDNDEDEGSYQRKKPKMTIDRYLQYKMKAEEKKRKEFLELEERKLKLEYKKLEIEQKKIDVFKSLVAALKKKNS